MMADLWPWVALIGLGAFHGINPAMGWLFAVALGLQRRRRRVVLLSLLPLALGHVLAIGATLVLVAALGQVLNPRSLRAAAGALLIGWGLYHAVRGHRHGLRIGMQAGMAGLIAWSFVMAMAHGAGLMLVPVFITWTGVGHHHSGAAPGLTLPLALAAIAVHTLATLAVTGVVAVAVYEWIGLAVLRRGWINLNWLWSTALIGVGAFLLATL